MFMKTHSLEQKMSSQMYYTLSMNLEYFGAANQKLRREITSKSNYQDKSITLKQFIQLAVGKINHSVTKIKKYKQTFS